ncbi:MAG: hypothetical protein OEY63_07070 [Gemmatimonadota bacterium]|nr:hypothetical protein [Gemmatimonadota bacterium]MDH5805534.1 hypothetical protein [Gemmatimonadota bacterium]
MIRTLTGYAVFAFIGIMALKLLFGLIGLAISLFFTVLTFAAIGFVLYLVLKVISPDTAQRVRDMIGGEKKAEV